MCLPTSYSLFPYTTLFRSALLAISNLHPLFDQSVPPGGLAGALISRDLQAGQDRKSTRLNSSHTVISYAVFCLKKKNTSNVVGTQRKGWTLLRVDDIAVWR